MLATLFIIRDNGSKGKVGVKLENNFLSKTVVLIKDRSKFAKQRNFSNKSFVKKRARQFVLFLMIVGAVNIGPLSSEAVFARKINFLKIRKTKVISIHFRLIGKV